MRFGTKATAQTDVTVVIRAAGERTASLCRELLSQQISNSSIHTVQEIPFSAALKKSYEIGLTEGRKWTMMIDADILVRSGIVDSIYGLAERQPSSVFAIQTEMLDKFFGGYRVGGIKLYRTKLLTKAIKIAPDINVRPETFVNKSMHKAGHYVHISDLICGLHDYEQFYEDIFRKGFAHGVKHASLIDLLLPYWQRTSKTDADFKVLLAGLKIGREFSGELKLEKDEVKNYYLGYMKRSKLKEKTDISKTTLTPAEVDGMLAGFIPPPEYAGVREAIDEMGRPVMPGPVKRFFRPRP